MRILVSLPIASLVVVSLLAATSRAQDLPFRSPLVKLGQQPKLVVAGDLDLDGDTDFVAGTTANNYVVALQSAPGVWTAQPAILAGANLTALALADINGDGSPDLAYLVDAPTLDLFVVRLGDGAGGFGNPMFNTTVAGPSDVDLVDVNGDGLLDAIVPGLASMRVAVHLGQGDGTFDPKADYVAGINPFHVAVGDWNGDLLPDLAITNNSAVAGERAVSVLLNAGAGTFGATLTLPMAVQVFDIETGDFDADGDADLAVGQAGLKAVLVLYGNGDGTFAPAQSVTSLLDARMLVVADLDEDGDDDIATTAVIVGASHVGVMLSLGDGSFEPVVRYGTIGNPTEVLAHDINDDGDIDLVVPCNDFIFGQSLTLLPGNGRGAFGPINGILGDSCPDVDFEDLDGDGRLDMVAASNLNDLVSVFPAQGDGVFSKASALSVNGAPGDGNRAQSVAVADLDGNGFGDIVVGVNAFPPEIDVFFGSGPFAFGPRIVIPVSAVAVDVHVADLDDDGAPDILALGRTNNTLMILRNLGGGVFAEPDLYATASAPYRLDTAEMNGDGLLDVVATTGGGTASDVVHVFRGNGDGSMQSVLTFTGGINHGGIAPGDADGDGDVDVAVVQSQAVSVLLLLNDGTGFLSAPISLTVGTTGGAGLVISDLDRDGIADLAAVGSSVVPFDGLGSLAFLRGTGGGAFAAVQRIETTSLPAQLVAADIDGDGAPDLAVPSVFDHVDLFLNRNGPWNDLQFPLAGSLGLPRQVGEGTLQDFAPFRFTLSDSRPNSPVAHFVGLTAINAPFKGGLLVPTPLLINFPLLTDATGELVLTGPWPSGAGGLTLYLQFWFQDPAGPVGFAASNALSATIPLP